MEWIQNNIANMLIIAFVSWVLWKRFLAPKLLGVKSMSAKEYVNFRDTAHTLLDVRSVGEWGSGHALEARHIPLSELSKRMTEIALQEPIVVICASGNRSAMAATTLAKSGFATVYNFSGGMAAWHNLDLPVKTDS